jgi:hypothetical protein
MEPMKFAASRATRACVVRAVVLGLWLAGALAGLAALRVEGVGQVRPTANPGNSWAGRPTSTAAVERGAAPQLAETRVPPADDAARWSLLWSDAFTDNAAAWDVGTVHLDLGTLRRTVADGAYQWDLDARRALLGWSESAVTVTASCRAAVDVRLAAGAPSGVDFGLALRPAEPERMIQVLFSTVLGVTVWRGIGDSARPVLDWTPAGALRAGDWNRLAVVASGARLTLFLNDRQIAEVPVEPVGESRVCLAVRANLPGRSLIQFDNLEIRGAAGSSSAAPTSPSPRALETPAPALPGAEIPSVRLLPPAAHPVPAAWPIVFADDFVDNRNHWATAEQFDRLIESSRQVDQTLAWQFRALQDMTSFLKVPRGEMTDFYAAFDVRRYSGPQDVWYGLSFRRVDSERFVVFLINDEGKFKVQARVKDQTYALVDTTRSVAIHPNTANRVAVLSEGQRVTCFVNGETVVSLELEPRDSQDRTGALALAVSADAEEEAIMEFDNFELRTPPGS